MIRKKGHISKVKRVGGAHIIDFKGRNMFLHRSKGRGVNLGHAMALFFPTIAWYFERGLLGMGFREN